MFYEYELKGHVRVSPELLGSNTEKAVIEELGNTFDGYMSKELGIVIAVSEIVDVGEGVIVPGDGAAYYDTTFKILTFQPEIHEIMLGKITDITDFGAFINMGPIDGMIHVSQTMDDFVSFSKSNVLTGKESRKVLKVNDICRARVIAVSFKEPTNPKIGLTMRQPMLGNIKWIEDELKKKKKKLKEDKK